MAREDQCDDVLMLPGSPSPSKNANKPAMGERGQGERLIPGFDLDVGTRGQYFYVYPRALHSSSLVTASTVVDDPFAVPLLEDKDLPSACEKDLCMVDPSAALGDGLQSDDRNTTTVRSACLAQLSHNSFLP